MVPDGLKSTLYRNELYLAVRDRYWFVRHTLANPYPSEFLENDVIFVHIPKCAGNAVTKALFSKSSMQLAGHTPASQFARARPDIFRRAFKFTFVRHPLDRFVSAFSFLKSGGMTRSDSDWSRIFLSECNTVHDFIRRLHDSRYRRLVMRHVHFRPQSHMIANANGELLVDFVGRQENFASDYDTVRARLGFGDAPQKVNVTKASHRFVQKLSSEEMDFVSKLYAQDFRLLGYDNDQRLEPLPNLGRVAAG